MTFRVSLRVALVGLLLSPALLLAACRQGTAQSGSSFIPITRSPFGNQGCNGPVAALVPPVLILTDPTLGHDSQMVAVAGAEALYYTGVGASIQRFEPPGPPTTLVASGTIDALLALVGITTPARLSGIAIVDVANLVVVEQTSNTLLLVSRLVPDTVSFLAGLPSETPGFADGVGGQIRFSFGSLGSVLATGDGLLFVADSGNHSVRLVTVGALPLSETVAGTGAPSFEDGELLSTALDTPSGLAVSCGGELLVSESGAAGVGGNRLRSLSVGTRAFFGGFDGSSLTLAGDGMPLSVEGIGGQASLAAPLSPVSSSDGLVFWVDSATGILRRLDLATGLVDCPLSAGCASPDFTVGGGFSLAITASGALYVLDGDASTLYRVTP